MKVFRKRGTRSSVALFSIAALALAMTGILYAHWTDTLEAHGVVETGSIDPQWSEMGTSDDGIDDPWDNEPRLDDLFDWWGPASSGDHSLLNGQIVDLRKDVGRCTVELSDQEVEGPDGVVVEENDRLDILIENGYPSYYCLIRADLHNFGSVPVKLQGISFKATKTFEGETIPVEVVPGPTLDGFQYFIDAAFDDDTDVDLEFNWDLLECGFQLDPRSEVLLDTEFHVDQDAMQNATYEIWISYEWVNWNEYDPELCEPIIIDIN